MLDTTLLAAKILIVDDEPDILLLCQSLLKAEGYTNIRVTSDSRGVLAHFLEYDPDLLILDLRMPHLEGLQLLEVLQATYTYAVSVPTLVITADSTPGNRLKALRSGAIDVLQKPFDREEFVLMVRNLLRIALAVRDIQQQNTALFSELALHQQELRATQMEVIARLARAGEHRDDDTGRHTQRVARAAGLIAHGMGLSAEESASIQHAAPLHDVGKIGVPDCILLKPGRLTNEELQIMQRHCEIGADLLSGGRSEIVMRAEHIALTHHEKWNGQGYPHGLGRDEIPIEGRVLAVADVFDALTHGRPYKRAWPVAEAISEIRHQSGEQFDPQVVDAFLELPHKQLIETPHAP